MNKTMVTISTDRGKLKLRWSVQGKRLSLSPNLNDTPEGWNAAELIAKQIELDIISGNYDHSKEKYRPKSRLKVVEEPIVQVPTVQKLWADYLDHRYATGLIKDSTMIKQMRPISNYLNRLKYRELEDFIRIRNQIERDKTPNGAKRLLTQISAACDWAVKSQVISENPFKDMASDIKVIHESDELDINPFTRQERDRIIEAFACSSYYCHYTALVKFLFFTGCRPGEAQGLTWKHIKPKYIFFEQVAATTLKGLGLREKLKTQKNRKVPINGQLRKLLDAHRPVDAKPNSLVFPSPNGGIMRQNNFRNRAWSKVLEGLGIEYRKPYQTRHTFITLCLDEGIDAKDIALWVGNSAEMIYRHYAGTNRGLEIPEL